MTQRFPFLFVNVMVSTCTSYPSPQKDVTKLIVEMVSKTEQNISLQHRQISGAGQKLAGNTTQDRGARQREQKSRKNPAKIPRIIFDSRFALVFDDGARVSRFVFCPANPPVLQATKESRSHCLLNRLHL